MPTTRARYDGFENDHANRYPVIASVAPSESNPMIRGVIAGLPQTVSGAHVSARRYHASTAPAPTRQIAAAVINAMRCGAATMATPASQALPRPRLPSSIGIAQHDAAPNAAASPPIASRSAPVSFAVSRSLGVDRASSVITAAYRGASRIPLRCAGAKQTRNHDAARTASRSSSLGSTSRTVTRLTMISSLGLARALPSLLR